MKKYFQLLYVVLLLLPAFLAHTETTVLNDFNLDQARTQLETIKQTLKNHKLKYDELNKTKQSIKLIKDHAEYCIKKSKKDLSQLESLSSTTRNDDASKKENKANDFLTQEKRKTKAMLSDCKLLLYESSKIKKQINLTIEQGKRSYSFLKTSPLWAVKDIRTLLELPSYNLQRLYQLSGIQHIQTKQLLFQLTTVIFLSLFAAYLIYRLLKKLLPSNKLATQLLKHFKQYLPLTFAFTMMHLFFTSTLQTAFSPSILTHIFKILATYTAVLLFIQLNGALFAYRKKSHIKHSVKKTCGIYMGMVSLLILSTLIDLLSPTEAISVTDLSGYKTLYLLLLSFLFLWTLHLSFQLIEKYKIFSTLQANLIRGGSFLFFLTLIAAAIAGFDTAALFVAENSIKTFVLFFIISEIIYLLWTYTRILNTKTHPVSIQFHQWIGLKTNKNMMELSILKFLVTLGLIRVFFHLFLVLWNLPAYYLSNIIDFFENEIYFFDVQINVVGMLRGLSIFCMVLILGRILGAFLSRKNTSAEQKNARITIITLTNYVTFIIAFLLSLMVIGINLSGFALVASALSVGIGFGLKGIAADLISGLILLLSKPLSPGDHIEVEGIEGFIQKIRLLSTEIKTLTEANVILPNSTLLGKSVVNYTYKNKLTRITSHIMLQDANDVKRAEAIMLKVAKKHPEIHQEGKNKPEIMVDLRAEKTALRIVLTLWCIIKDVEDRYRINSDINAKVLAAIEKAGIPLKL